MSIEMARADDAGFWRVAPVVPSPRVGATGKRGRRRYGRTGTPHARPSSPKAARRREARAYLNGRIQGIWAGWTSAARKAA